MNLENIKFLGGNDIVLASYPGSGSTWLGSLFINLGIFYLNGYQEVFLDSYSQKTTILPVNRRDRLPDYRDRDNNAKSFLEPIRVSKTHLVADTFAPNRNFKVIILVRDGRDALISYYHWLCGFSKLSISLDDFIRHGTPRDSTPPAQSWATFHQGWMNYLDQTKTHLVRFEDMRANPLHELQWLMQFLGIHRQEDELHRAINDCSFSAMRQKELAAVNAQGAKLGNGMIMRRGEIGEWRSALTLKSAELIENQGGEFLRLFKYLT